jgi:hypothetical protein
VAAANSDLQENTLIIPRVPRSSIVAPRLHGAEDIAEASGLVACYLGECGSGDLIDLTANHIRVIGVKCLDGDKTRVISSFDIPFFVPQSGLTGIKSITSSAFMPDPNRVLSAPAIIADVPACAS